MRISSEERLLLCKGLDFVITSKEIEINNIKSRTEEDYSAAIALEKIIGAEFSLDTRKARDIEKINNEITEIKKFKHEINSLRNNLLLVPDYIKLHLKSE